MALKLKFKEVAIVRRVSQRALGQRWFNRNFITERELLKVVLNAWRDGLQEEDRLSKHVLKEARKRFAKR